MIDSLFCDRILMTHELFVISSDQNLMTRDQTFFACHQRLITRELFYLLCDRILFARQPNNGLLDVSAEAAGVTLLDEPILLVHDGEVGQHLDGLLPRGVHGLLLLPFGALFIIRCKKSISCLGEAPPFPMAHRQSMRCE